MELKNIQPSIDKSAIAISLLCVAHCLMTPITLTLMPAVLAESLGDERLHQLLVLLILPTSTIALFLGCRRHRSWEIVGFGIIGLVVLVVTALLGEHALGSNGEKFGTVLGSCIIVYSHYRNYQLCRALQCVS